MTRFGWIPDLPDQRDRRFAVPATLDLPDVVDLRDRCPPVMDQGDLGSCVANAIAAAHQFVQAGQGRRPFMPSRLFTYWNARWYEGTTSIDNGCMIRSGMRSVVRQGVPPETIWPYDPAIYQSRPTDAAYASAEQAQAIQYRRVAQNARDLMGCLASGFPIVVGLTLYESFDRAASTGWVAMPTSSERMIGGHAVLAVGYNAEAKRFLFQNSWGDRWGFRGYFGVPFDYMLDPDLSADFWTMTEVE